MNTKRLLAVGVLVALSACKGSCSCGVDDNDDDDDSSGTGGSGQVSVTVGTGGSPSTGSDTGTGTGGTGTGTGGGEPEGGAQTRLANLAPDSDDAGYNFCLQGEGAEEAIGPLAEAALAFGDYTQYAGIEEGTYSVIIVGSGAEDCGTALFTFDGIELSDAQPSTLALIGLISEEDGDLALSLAQYSDNLDPASEETFVKARFIHGAPGAPPVVVGYYEADEFVPRWGSEESPIEYAQDGGYIEVPEFDTLELVAQVEGEDVPGTETTVNGVAGSTVEGIAVGSPTSGFSVLVIETPPAE
jgi:hypothetical protein